MSKSPTTSIKSNFPEINKAKLLPKYDGLIKSDPNRSEYFTCIPCTANEYVSQCKLIKSAIDEFRGAEIYI